MEVEGSWGNLAWSHVWWQIHKLSCLLALPAQSLMYSLLLLLPSSMLILVWYALFMVFMVCFFMAHHGFIFFGNKCSGCSEWEIVHSCASGHPAHACYLIFVLCSQKQRLLILYISCIKKSVIGSLQFIQILLIFANVELETRIGGELVVLKTFSLY